MLTLAASGDPGTLTDLFVVLALAGVTALLMGRAGIAAIPAFIIAGAVAGPHAAGLVSSADELGAISDLAIILLLFGIGMHIDPEELGRGSLGMVLAGVVSILGCITVLWPLGLAFGLDWAGALALAIALSVSSTAVVLRRLMQRRELKLPAGRLALTILIVQDLAVPIMLIAIEALGRLRAAGDDAAPANPLGVAITALSSVAGAALIVVLGRLFLPRLLRQASSIGSDEVMLTLGIAVAMGAAIATNELGFSYELGAFLAGLVLGGTPFRHQVGALMGPARDFFLAVFFTTLGMRVDPEPLREMWPAVVLGGTVMIAVKSVVIGASSWAFWGTGLVAGTVGLTLAQAGEFSLILLDSAESAGLLGEASMTSAAAIVVISLILTPVPIALGRGLSGWLERIPAAPWRHAAAESDGPGHTGDGPRVIVGGFGPIGRAAVELLEKQGLSAVIVEMNEKTVRTNTRLGRSMVFGDVSRADVLESAGIRHADALVLTTPDEDANLRTCQTAKAMNPSVCVVTRMNHLGKGLRAKTLGADAIVVEEVAAAEAMGRVLSERFGVVEQHLEDA